MDSRFFKPFYTRKSVSTLWDTSTSDSIISKLIWKKYTLLIKNSHTQVHDFGLPVATTKN